MQKTLESETRKWKGLPILSLREAEELSKQRLNEARKLRIEAEQRADKAEQRAKDAKALETQAKSLEERTRMLVLQSKTLEKRAEILEQQVKDFMFPRLLGETWNPNLVELEIIKQFEDRLKCIKAELKQSKDELKCVKVELKIVEGRIEIEQNKINSIRE